MQDSQTGVRASVPRHRSARATVPRVLVAALLLGTSGQVVRAEAPITAASAPAPVFTLDQALAAAGSSAPGLDAAAADLRAAQAGRTVAGLRPNPEVQVQVENVGGTGEFRGTQSAETNLPFMLGRIPVVVNEGKGC